MSISLLVGAGLCLRSLNQATQMTPGFQADGVVVGWLDLFSAGYTAEEGRAYYARVLERVRALPGVESVTLSRRIPLGFIGGGFSDVTVDGHTASDRDPQGVGLNNVGPDYATTMKIPMVAGRDLSLDRHLRSTGGGADQRDDGANLLEGSRSGWRPLHVRQPAPGPGAAVDHGRRRHQGHQAALAHRAAVSRA